VLKINYEPNSTLIPMASNAWLAMSASEWIPSDNMDPEPMHDIITQLCTYNLTIEIDSKSKSKFSMRGLDLIQLTGHRKGAKLD